MIRLAKTNNYVLFSPSKQEVSEQCAPECIPLVLEPKSMFYNDPVIVFDFRSLYPSIIIAYNLCYSTCLGKLSVGQGEMNQKKFGASTISLPRGLLKSLKKNLAVTPNEVMFVTSQVRQGILPRYAHIHSESLFPLIFLGC